MIHNHQKNRKETVAQLIRRSKFYDTPLSGWLMCQSPSGWLQVAPIVGAFFCGHWIDMDSLEMKKPGINGA